MISGQIPATALRLPAKRCNLDIDILINTQCELVPGGYLRELSEYV